MAIEWRDVPVIGTFITAGTIFVQFGLDLLVQFGDMIGIILLTLLQSVDLWLPMLSTLNRFGSQIPGFSTEWTTHAIMIGLLLMLGLRVVRFANYLKKQILKDEN